MFAGPLAHGAQWATGPQMTHTDDFVTLVEPNEPRNLSFFILFKKRETFEQHRKPELSLSLNDFQSFEFLGFPSDLFSPLYLSKQTSKIHTCENTCISENINTINEISTIRPLNITTNRNTFFHDLLKRNLSKSTKKTKKNIPSLKHH